MRTTKMGFNFNQAPFDSFAIHNVVFEFKLCQKYPGTHVYALIQNMEW